MSSRSVYLYSYLARSQVYNPSLSKLSLNNASVKFFELINKILCMCCTKKYFERRSFVFKDNLIPTLYCYKY